MLALKLIRDNEIELELIEADMGKKIADIKEQAAEQAVPVPGMTSRSWSCRSRSL